MINDKLLLEYLHDKMINTVLWCDKFKSGERDYDYDFDDANLLYEFSEKRNFTSEKSSYFLVYNLLDFYCDAVKHSFSEVQEGYDIEIAKSDIVTIAEDLKNNNFKSLEIRESLQKRLEQLFD